MIEDFEDANNPFVSKSDFELFKEEDNIAGELLRVKRSASKDGEKWSIIKDKKVLLSIKGERFTKRQREFLYKPEGIKYLLDMFKSGVNTQSGLRDLIAKKVEDDNV